MLGEGDDELSHICDKLCTPPGLNLGKEVGLRSDLYAIRFDRLTRSLLHTLENARGLTSE